MVQQMNFRQKRILIVSHHFYPEINPRAFRSAELCREFISCGYAVDVIYAHRKLILSSEKVEQFLIDAVDIPKNTASTPQKSDDSLFKWLFRFFFAEKFMLTTLPWLRKVLHLNDYDAVLSIGTPFYVHIAVAEALQKNSKHIASVCDNGDPFFNYKVRDKAFYFGMIQRRTFSAFDYVCTPIEGAVEYYAKFVPPEKIRVVPQGYNIENVAVSNYTKCDIPTFAFAGRFYKDIRNPQSLLAFLSQIDVPFRFIVFAPTAGIVYDEVLVPYLKQLGGRLVIRDFIPREECIVELSKVDFLINLENTLSVQSPSKIVDYALAARPILSFSQDEIPKEKLLRWLSGECVDPLLVDIAPFNIKNICKQFAKLLALE